MSVSHIDLISLVRPSSDFIAFMEDSKGLCCDAYDRVKVMITDGDSDAMKTIQKAFGGAQRMNSFFGITTSGAKGVCKANPEEFAVMSALHALPVMGVMALLHNDYLKDVGPEPCFTYIPPLDSKDKSNKLLKKHRQDVLAMYSDLHRLVTGTSGRGGIPMSLAKRHVIDVSDDESDEDYHSVVDFDPSNVEAESKSDVRSYISNAVSYLTGAGAGAGGPVQRVSRGSVSRGSASRHTAARAVPARPTAPGVFGYKVNESGKVHTQACAAITKAIKGGKDLIAVTNPSDNVCKNCASMRFLKKDFDWGANGLCEPADV